MGTVDKCSELNTQTSFLKSGKKQGTTALLSHSLIPHLGRAGEQDCFAIFCRQTFILWACKCPKLMGNHVSRSRSQCWAWTSTLSLRLELSSTKDTFWICSVFYPVCWTLPTCLYLENTTWTLSAKVSLERMDHLKWFSCQGPGWDFFFRGAASLGEVVQHFLIFCHILEGGNIWSHSQCLILLIKILLVSVGI